mgnify:CR=1 FL=1
MLENWISKNNKAWNLLFQKFNILEQVNHNGFYEITANDIKISGREPRLMTKFDSKEDLPKIFKKHNLAILPIKRGSYIIGRFQNYQTLSFDNGIEVETKYLPDFITTIHYQNISSEAVSLNAAYISGMLEDIAGEVVVPTISGRMGTKEFRYHILLDDQNTFQIKVEKSQMEIDGSYEGISKFIIVEAKNHYLEDFIIRQLYYPYKVWKSKTSKEIVPVMLIKHDNIFNFFIYSFEDEDNYNSIRLDKIKRYILDEPYIPIEITDVISIMDHVVFVSETNDVPFPQANTFHLVLDLLYELNSRAMTSNDITNFLEYDPRQTKYYIDAARYLGFVKKENKRYFLTDHGKKIMRMNHKERTLEIISSILSHRPFYLAMQQQLENFSFDKLQIAKLIDECRDEINQMSTAKRRAGTVIAWIKWILDMATHIDDPDFDK